MSGGHFMEGWKGSDAPTVFHQCSFNGSLRASDRRHWRAQRKYPWDMAIRFPLHSKFVLYKPGDYSKVNEPRLKGERPPGAYSFFS